jgi:hypothetical protein
LYSANWASPSTDDNVFRPLFFFEPGEPRRARKLYIKTPVEEYNIMEDPIRKRK